VNLPLPVGACDAHCHVFGPAARFPFDPGRTYTPDDAPGGALMALHHRFGFDHAILVQPACHGLDLTAMLDTIAASHGAYRGVALVPVDVAEVDLLAMHRGGIRGVRFNFVPHLGPPPDIAALRRVADIAAPLGWHIGIHARVEDLPALHAILATLPLPFAIDHLARIDAALGVDQPGLDDLLRVLALPNAWLKISGADRASAIGAPFNDVLPILRRVIEHRPERLVWGTDWPHPNIRGPVPDEADLLALFRRAAGSAALEQRILVDNPRALYRFDLPLDPPLQED
jgi:predicted TIM-barrel fold metal-dependent hydrolase